MRATTDCPKCEATVVAHLPHSATVRDLEGNGVYVGGSHLGELYDQPTGNCGHHTVFHFRLKPDTGVVMVRTYTAEEF